MNGYKKGNLQLFINDYILDEEADDSLFEMIKDQISRPAQYNSHIECPIQLFKKKVFCFGDEDRIRKCHGTGSDAEGCRTCVTGRIIDHFEPIIGGA